VLNIGHVLRLAGLPDVPVAVGASGPMQGEAHIAHYVHGNDGLGDVVDAADKAQPATVVDRSSAEHLIQLATDRPGYYDLLTLGPLTNVGLALQQQPDLLTLFRQVVIMGGSGPFPPLGTSLMIDANIQNDATAAKLVFDAPCARRVMVGVNVTRTVITDEQQVLALHRSGSPIAQFAADILESYMDFYRFAWGRRVSPVHDGLAAAMVIRPDLIIESMTGPVNITTDGFATRAHLMRTADGLPVAWTPDPAPDSIAVTGVNVEAFQHDFLDALIGQPVPPRPG
jgi:purine nucleosidase